MTDRIEKTDVLICGGGLAGLTLALQLKRSDEALSITVIESLARPLPEARFKVGESTVEIATKYFVEQLGLGECLEKRHFRKLGLRFFMGDAHRPFVERDEVGLRVFPPFTTYQVDRGRLENDLREIVVANGVNLIEGTRVSKIDLASGNDDHRISATCSASAEPRMFDARWVVDATGRRRLLQRQLGLSITDNGHQASAAWFRIDTKVSVSAMVPPSERAWHRRIIEDRWKSTNHLVGKGYWIWLIPLASGQTSVGVVLHSVTFPNQPVGPGYASIEPWLQQHEPELARLLAKRELSDYKAISDYSFGSSKLFSAERWACVGESGLFTDPFYSPGSDFIAIANSITAQIIRDDFGSNEISDSKISDLNWIFIDGLYKLSLPIYSAAFNSFDKPQVFVVKHLWDAALYWSVTCKLFMNPDYTDERHVKEIRKFIEKLVSLQYRVQTLLEVWASKVTPKRRNDFFDVSLIPYLQLIVLDLNVKHVGSELMTILNRNLDRLEEAANLIFLTAVREVFPEHNSLFDGQWVNAWAISLEPERWQSEGLFEPKSPPRDLGPIAQALFADVMAPLNFKGKLRRQVFRLFMGAFNGRMFYAVSGNIRNLLKEGRLTVPRSWFIAKSSV